MTYLIIILLIIIIIFGLKKLYKKKSESRLKEKKAYEFIKQNKELFELQKKFMGEKGTDLDIMPEGIGEFGLEVTNPIPTSTVFGSIAYLNKLKTSDGDNIEYNRIGSTGAENISDIIDAYQITKNGEKIGVLYLCPYNKKNSEKAPAGYLLGS